MPLESFTSTEPLDDASSSASSGTAVGTRRRPLLELEESLTFTTDECRLFINAKEKEEGVGTLWITNKSGKDKH